MNTHPESDRVFPLSGGSPERPSLRPPRLTVHPRFGNAPLQGHRAFIRAWAARRAAVQPAGPARPADLMPLAAGPANSTS